MNNLEGKLLLQVLDLKPSDQVEFLLILMSRMGDFSFLLDDSFQFTEAQKDELRKRAASME